MDAEHALTAINTLVNLVVPVSLYLFRNYAKVYVDKKAENLATREDVKALSQLSEKGKNLATLEDIGPITMAAEKAKNAATREDVEAITRAIEAVKHDFDVRGKSIQARIDIASSAHNDIATLRREAWINFFNDCAELLDDLLRVSPGDFVHAELGEKLVAHQNAMNTMFTKIVRDYTSVALFSPPESRVPKLAHDVVLQMFLVRDAFRQHYSPLKMALLAELGKPGRAGAAHTDFAYRWYRTAIESPEAAMRRAFGLYIRELNSELNLLDPENALATHFGSQAKQPEGASAEPPVPGEST